MKSSFLCPKSQHWAKMSPFPPRFVLRQNHGYVQHTSLHALRVCVFVVVLNQLLLYSISLIKGCLPLLSVHIFTLTLLRGEQLNRGFSTEATYSSLISDRVPLEQPGLSALLRGMILTNNRPTCDFETASVLLGIEQATFVKTVQILNHSQ